MALMQGVRGTLLWYFVEIRVRDKEQGIDKTGCEPSPRSESPVLSTGSTRRCAKFLELGYKYVEFGGVLNGFNGRWNG